jgi:hypothetical protein
MAEQNTEGQNQQPQKRSYGKLTKAQWIVIYIVGAVIVYGLIYLLFIHKNGTGGY